MRRLRTESLFVALPALKHRVRIVSLESVTEWLPLRKPVRTEVTRFPFAACQDSLPVYSPATYSSTCTASTIREAWNQVPTAAPPRRLLWITTSSHLSISYSTGHLIVKMNTRTSPGWVSHLRMGAFYTNCSKTTTEFLTVVSAKLILPSSLPVFLVRLLYCSVLLKSQFQPKKLRHSIW